VAVRSEITDCSRAALLASGGPVKLVYDGQHHPAQRNDRTLMEYKTGHQGWKLLGLKAEIYLDKGLTRFRG
jgi:hypothetical protein